MNSSLWCWMVMIANESIYVWFGRINGFLKMDIDLSRAILDVEVYIQKMRSGNTILIIISKAAISSTSALHYTCIHIDSNADCKSRFIEFIARAALETT